MQTLENILGIIMGGGRGARLFPLTRDRAKPAVPIAGKYRLIDVPISNCINSGIHHVAVLTQFNSVSLHHHITRTYNFDPFHPGWVQIWAAEQTFSNETWYQGTADAVRKQLFEITSARTQYVLILAGDHIYSMDYAKMARFHWENEADITVAVQPVPTEAAPQLGLLKRSPDGLITDFVEKPKDAKVLKKFVSTDDPERPYLGSMGIYFFKTDVLIDLLGSSKDDDFGREVIPKAIKTHKVWGFNFGGYWEDIGTIRAFYEVNLKLASSESPFNFHDPQSRIYSRPRFLPSTRVDGATLEDVLLADGCLICKAEIQNSVIGLRSHISDGAVIRNTVMMGADYFDNPDDLAKGQGIALGIGAKSVIEGALIDKNARIGEGVIIKPFPLGTEIDKENYNVRDGIVVVPKRAVIHPGTVIAPEKPSD